MEEKERKGYYAFISYKREEEKWADWLQKKLENYRLPSNLNGREDLPKAIRPVFKDTTELNPTYLPQQIQEALADSKFLIVICSPLAAKSQWVNKEVETFIEMGRTDYIIPFIIEGEPHAADPESECYPKALRDLPANKEILGANIKEFSKDAALVKVIAQMLGLKFDVLWQRAEKYERKQNKIRWALICSLLALSVCIGVFLFSQNWRIKENHTRYMIKEISSLIDNGESYKAARLALALLPKNRFLPDRPYLIEIEALLREALNRESTILYPDDSHLATFSPDGSLIAIEGFNMCRIYRTKDGVLLHELIERHYNEWGDWVDIKGFSTDGKYLVTSYYVKEDSTSTNVWNVQTGEKEWNVADVDIVSAISIEDGKSHIVFNKERTKYLRSSYVHYGIILRDTVSGSFISDFQNNTEFTEQISYTRSGQHVIVRNGKQFVVWDSHTGKVEKEFPNAWCIFMGSPRPLYVTTDNKTISVRDARDGRVLYTLGRHIDLEDISNIYFSKSGRRIVVEADWGEVYIFDSQTGKELLSLSVSTEGSFVGAISNDDKIYVSSGIGVGQETYDLETGEMMDYDQGGYYTQLCISDDNKWIAGVYEDKDLISIFDCKSCSCVKSFPVPEVNWVAFSPDSKLLLTCHNDSTVRVWDLKTYQLMSTLRGHHGPVVSGAFSADGREIISSSANGEIKRWQYLPSWELIDKARERFKEVPLTKEEKEQYFF